MDNNKFNFREELLNPLNRPKKYVTYLPYIEGENRRFRANIFTALDYTESQIIAQENTDGALNYADSFLNGLLEYDAAVKDIMGNTGEQTITLSVDLGYFIDSRYRTEKNFKPALSKEDFITGLHTVTIRGSYKKDGQEYYKRETFVVNLEAFLQALSSKGYSVSIYTSSGELIKTLVEVGIEASPRLEITAVSKKMEEKSSKSLT